MPVVIALILFANALFNIVAWPSFFRRVLRDPRARDAAGRPTAFLRVHAVLVGIALLLAVASVVAGVLLLITT
ncbi:SCO4848 family membrane protein [Microbacterium sp. P01]|uniref:SCO4848 family membrane protein n=1 Tax=unclassified Microbacterium TaxID=2609290 RepID=UPI0036708B2E